MHRIRLAVFIWWGAWAAFAQDTAGVGSISGTAKIDTGAAASIRVCVRGTVRCASTTETGTFSITDVRSGTYALEISAPGRPALPSTDVEVRAGLDTRVEIVLPRLDGGQQSVTVSESAFVPSEEIKNSGYLVSRYEIFKAAGAEQDVSRYVQTLPGVGIGTNDFRNDLIVRGGSPLENLFLVDNVEIPNINNFANFASAGGTTSLLDADLIRDVTFLTGGMPAPFPNRTSSVLQVAQREGSREGFSARLSLGSAGLGAILEGPIRKGRGSWVVSAKRSFIDAFTSDIGIGGVPVNYNFNNKTLYDLTPRDRIWLINITGVDTIRIGRTDKKYSDEDRDPELNLIDLHYDGWRSASGFNWQHVFGTKGVGLLGVSSSEGSVTQTTKDLFKFGLTASSAADLIAKTPVLFSEKNREGEGTVKYNLTTYVPVLDKVQLGGSWKIQHVNYDTAQPYGQDNPYSELPGLNAFYFNKSAATSQTGLYGQATRNFGPRLNLTWGGRFDNFQAIGKNRISPRAGLSYRITDKLSFKSSYGMYFQQPLLLFVESFAQNRGLNPIRATHVVSGFGYALGPTTRVSVEAYLKEYNSYPVSSQLRSFSLSNAGDTFAVTDILLPYVSAGKGRARGIELLAEKKFGSRWYGQTNVSFSRTKFAALDGIFRPGTYDYPVIFNAVGGYKLTRKWDLSARIVYLSGKPYTPFNEALSKSEQRGIYDLGRINALRAPDYFRLDVRVDRTFLVRKKPLLVFAGVQNLTDRRNIAQQSWDRVLGTTRFNRQLGLFPTIGLDWKF
jgi:hypothetical protein